jgi:hypothetical protein
MHLTSHPAKQQGHYAEQWPKAAYTYVCRWCLQRMYADMHQHELMSFKYKLLVICEKWALSLRTPCSHISPPTPWPPRPGLPNDPSLCIKPAFHLNETAAPPPWLIMNYHVSADMLKTRKQLASSSFLVRETVRDHPSHPHFGGNQTSTTKYSRL